MFYQYRRYGVEIERVRSLPYPTATVIQESPAVSGGFVEYPESGISIWRFSTCDGGGVLKIRTPRSFPAIRPPHVWEFRTILCAAGPPLRRPRKGHFQRGANPFKIPTGRINFLLTHVVSWEYDTTNKLLKSKLVKFLSLSVLAFYGIAKTLNP